MILWYCKKYVYLCIKIKHVSRNKKKKKIAKETLGRFKVYEYVISIQFLIQDPFEIVIIKTPGNTVGG